MKLLLISEYFPESEHCEIKGGVETRAFAIAKELAKKHEVTVLCSREKNQPKEQRFANMRIMRCGPERSYTQIGDIPKRLRFIFAAYQEGCKLDADLVDGYNYITYIPAMWIGKKKNIPAIATYHDVWVGEWVKHIGLIGGILGEILERYILRGKGKHWTQFITNSEVTRQELITYGIPKEKTTAVYSGVYVDRYQKLKAKPYAKSTVIYVGRLVPYKRINDLIQAISIVKKQIPNIQCKIIGTGPEKENLAKLIKEEDLKEQVELVGFVEKHEDVMKGIKSSQVFCLPSAVEGLGLVTIEAMACGTPYVNSDIPPTRECTENGKGGILYELGNIKQLAKGIVSLMKNKELHAQKSEEARILAKKYDWPLLAKRVEEVYRSVIKSR